MTTPKNKPRAKKPKNGLVWDGKRRLVGIHAVSDGVVQIVYRRSGAVVTNERITDTVALETETLRVLDVESSQERAAIQALSRALKALEQLALHFQTQHEHEREEETQR